MQLWQLNLVLSFFFSEKPRLSPYSYSLSMRPSGQAAAGMCIINPED
jgi:hypothetical protein